MNFRRCSRKCRPAGEYYFTASLILLLLLLLSCSRETGKVNHSFRVIDEDGTPTALTSGGPKYVEPIFDYEPVATIQQDDDEEETLLYRPGFFFMDEGGCFYVEDIGNDRVAVFNPEGYFIRSFGREGDGPGEFRSFRILSVRNRVVAVFDRRHRTTSLFQTDGTLLKTCSSPNVGRDLDGIYPGPEGSMILTTVVSEDRDQSDEGAERYEGRQIAVMSSRGDTLSFIETPKIKTGYVWYDPNAPMAVRLEYPFHGRPQALYVPGKGILVTTGREAVLEWYDLRGYLEQRVRVDMTREPVTVQDRADIYDRWDRRIEDAPDARFRRSIRRHRELTVIPDTKDFCSRIIVDDYGYIWIQKTGDTGLMSEKDSVPFRVLSPEGEYLGDTDWPTYSGTLSQGHYLTSHYDEEAGVRVLVAYRIRPVVSSLHYP